jgi:hypothetical protein
LLNARPRLAEQVIDGTASLRHQAIRSRDCRVEYRFSTSPAPQHGVGELVDGGDDGVIAARNGLPPSVAQTAR